MTTDLFPWETDPADEQPDNVPHVSTPWPVVGRGVPADREEHPAASAGSPDDDPPTSSPGATGGTNPESEPTAVDVFTGLGAAEVGGILDRFAPAQVRDGWATQAADAVRTAVRQRADSRRECRVAANDQPPRKPADLRVDLVGAADDADVLDTFARVFAAGATEARGITGDLLDELPTGRDGKPRASAKVGDGQGCQLAVTRTQRRDLSVDDAEVDDVIVAYGVSTVPATLSPRAAYAAGMRDGLSALRRLLTASPAYRSTVLDALVTELGDAGEDDLSKRLAKAYGRVEKGEPSIKLARTPLDENGAAS